MEQGPDLPHLETLCAAALYLATNYARSGCPMLCQMVMRQLACILNYPGEDSVSPALREACRRLYAEWERIGIERTQALAAGTAAANRHLH